MKASKLIQHLQDLVYKYGDLDVDLITETTEVQTEQPLGDVGYSPLHKRIKLMPEGF